MPSLYCYIEKRTNLNPVQSCALRTLITSCGREDTRTVTYPEEEEDTLHYLLWNREPESGDRKLAGALAILPLDESTVECIALIHPLSRRKGSFTRLLSLARRDFDRYDFLFPVPKGAGDVIASLKAAGAEYDHTDLMMEYLTAKCLTAQILPDALIPEVFVWPEGTANPIGSCRIIALSPDCVCLCQVEISPASRGHGQGAAMIRCLLDRLQQCGISRIILHVEKENIPAVALYKKTGFRVIETLSYSLLPSISRTDD